MGVPPLRRHSLTQGGAARILRGFASALIIDRVHQPGPSRTLVPGSGVFRQPVERVVIPAVMPTYARVDLAIERGEGCWLFGGDGRRYLDFTSRHRGHGAGPLPPAPGEGAAGPGGDAVALLEPVPHSRPGKAGRAAGRRNTFADTVFFTNSGVEAMECSIKVVRKYHDDTGNPGRFRIITCGGAFHGRSLATLAAGRQEKYLKGFEPMVEGFDQVAFGNLNEMRAAISDDTAAILVEPVQGEGGIRVGTVDYLKALREICDEFGLLLMYDEVQCGVGRTGKLFAHEWADGAAKPDVMAIAKGIGSGFPVGACLTTEKVAKGMTYGTHGTTFGGNPLAMAAANAVLDVVLAPGFLEGVQARSKVFRQRLEAIAKKHPKAIDEVRGSGLLLGIKCVQPNGQMVDALRAEGLLVVGAGDNVVRILPPLTASPEELEQGAQMIERAAAKQAAAAGSA
jgi:acetylornithine/N-succinyldiaminopimelate aminotransferase